MAGELQFIEIKDFRPGIFSSFGAATTATGLPSGRSSIPANGAASPDYTYRCHADARSGALVPLPVRTAGPTQTLVPEGNAKTSPAYYPTGTGAVAHIIDGVAFPADSITGAVHVCVGYAFNYATAGGSSAYVGYVLARMHIQAGATTRDLAFMRHAGTGFGTGMSANIAFEKTRTRTAAGSGTYHPSLAMVAYFVGAFPTTGAISAADQALTTYDTDAAATYPNTSRDPLLLVWPAAATATSNVPTQVDGTASPSNDQWPIVFGHQGRLLVPNNQTGTFGAGSNTGALEFLRYTPVDAHASAAMTELFIAHEAPGGYGTGHSMSANELLLIKHAGGAVLIRGDLDNPEVVRLPMVASTQSVHVRGAATPLGFVYGNRQGVHVWSGGETSKRLSSQLDGWFWRHELDQTNETYTYQQRGRFAWWDPFVVAPANWLFDTEGGGWWRLDQYGDPASDAANPMPMHAYDVSPAGTLYAFHYKLTSTWNTPFSYFAPHTKASTYSWQSQPLIETRDRTITPRQINLVAQVAAGASGAQTVTVTLTGLKDDGTTVVSVDEPITLTGMGPDPVFIRHTPDGTNVASLQGVRYLKVRLQASSASGPAPSVLSVGVGYRDSHTQADR